MLVGLIADTHDRLHMVDKAVKKLNEENVELVLHAGDYRELLKKRFGEHEELEMRGNFAEIVVDGLKIALLHGNEEELLMTLINGESFDVVVHGHTHKAEVYRKGKTLVVNPGEVCGYLTGKSTVALLDIDKREAKVIELFSENV